MGLSLPLCPPQMARFFLWMEMAPQLSSLKAPGPGQRRGWVAGGRWACAHSPGLSLLKGQQQRQGILSRQPASCAGPRGAHLVAAPALFLFFKLFYFIYFWLHWVLVAALGLLASGGYSSLRCAGFSLRWLLLLRSTGTRARRLQ